MKKTQSTFVNTLVLDCWLKLHWHVNNSRLKCWSAYTRSVNKVMSVINKSFVY